MRLVITRRQFNMLKEIFEEYDIDQVIWTEENVSGIGPSVEVEYDAGVLAKRDLSDVESW